MVLKAASLAPYTTSSQAPVLVKDRYRSGLITDQAELYTAYAWLVHIWPLLFPNNFLGPLLTCVPDRSVGYSTSAFIRITPFVFYSSPSFFLGESSRQSLPSGLFTPCPLQGPGPSPND
jgi:hypothetical protein